MLLSSFWKLNLKCLCDIWMEISVEELDYPSETQEIWARDGYSGVISIEIFLKTILSELSESPQNNV